MKAFSGASPKTYNTPSGDGANNWESGSNDKQQLSRYVSLRVTPKSLSLAGLDPSPTSSHFLSRAPISPPPLRRTPSSVNGQSAGSPDRSVPGLGLTSATNSARRLSGATLNGTISQKGSPASAPHLDVSTPRESKTTPKAKDAPATGWTTKALAAQLDNLNQEICEGHVRLLTHALQSSVPTEQRVATGVDLFAGMTSQPRAREQGKTMRIKFKQHFLKTKKDNREEQHLVTPITTQVGRVPGYRYHHVEIKKNILTPNTPNLFTPHLRDLDPGQEARYHEWLRDLEDKDVQTNFKPMQREEKYARTIQIERTRTVALFLDNWLSRLAIPGCGKSDLISYMARQDPTDAMTPQQRTDILNSQGQASVPIMRVNEAVAQFTDAFARVFELGRPEQRKIRLRDVLLLDESVDSIMDAKLTAKEGNDANSVVGTNDGSVDGDSLADGEQAHLGLATYSILGCLICFSHGCDHGEFKADNNRQTFSFSSGLRTIGKVLKMRRSQAITAGMVHVRRNEAPCSNHCYRTPAPPQQSRNTQAFSTGEDTALAAVVGTTNFTKITTDPICLVASLLNRDCYAVDQRARALDLGPPLRVERPPITRVKPLSWYDRNKKVLLGDWQDHLRTDPKVRQIVEPCFHAGPCIAGTCACVDNGLLCDRFCGCPADTCAYRYTGCACRSLGKSCQQKQHEKSTCICVQLMRECDPELCGYCGAFQRADPSRARDHELHQTGCQNVAMQRAVTKSLLLGQSQLPGVMFGLFTAEDIAQDDFVVEYLGELISQDEGTRREARRSDVFSQTSSPSYLFTLLEEEGIWVDAAVYGNLSRYINHSSIQHEERGCNVTPRVLYVNGEFRIKFVAMRDIQAGEELFFDYGKEFPNLESLVESVTGQKTQRGKRRRRQARFSGEADSSALLGRKDVNNFSSLDTSKTERYIGGLVNEADDSPQQQRKRKRGARDSTDGDEYQPRPGQRRKLTQSNTGSLSGVTGGLGTNDGSKKATRTSRRDRAAKPTSEPVELPKAKGKRGGARPGSGRPRKHPRPVSRTPTTQRQHHLHLPGQQQQQQQRFSPESPTSRIATKPSAVSGTPREIEDSQGEAEAEELRNGMPGASRVAVEVERVAAKHNGPGDDLSPGSATQGPVQREMARLEADAYAFVLDDDEDEDDEGITQDRNGKTIRSPRNRRLPAKLREQEWSM